MKVIREFLNGGYVLQPNIFDDHRGFFMEVFKKSFMESIGVAVPFIQENHSLSQKRTVRGLHFQYDKPMMKLMRVTRGTAFLVAVDIRKGSPTLGKWFGVEVSAENKLQVFAPAGFARGFCALSEEAEIQYLCTAEYNKNGESGILWNDPEIGIEWPVKKPILSEKDAEAQTLKEWLARPESETFRYEKT